MRHLLLAFYVIATVGLPGPGFALSDEEARHLLVRTGFDAAPGAVTPLAPLDRQAAAQRLIAAVRTQTVIDPPTWVNDPLPDVRVIRRLSEAERKALQQRLREQSVELKAWWYTEMLATDTPLSERMTLFWHNHFTSGLRKVKSPTLIYRQNVLLRRHALGSFRELLHAVARDPAMVVYLDNQTNHREKPNENFARELLELFTLGEGHYTEQDVKAAARAFTGWMVDRETGAFRFNPRQHDDGMKTFLGRNGNFNGDDILDIVLAQPRTAEHLTEKLWREFISPTPAPQEVKRLADIFRANGYELRPLLEALFTSTHFWDAASRGSLVKSPVELIVGTLRFFDIPTAQNRLLARAGAALGQNLFDPPNVKGWPGGDTWIASNTLLMRQQLLERILRGREMPDDAHRRGDAAATPLSETSLAGQSVKALQPLLLPLPPVNDQPAETDTLARVRQLALDPVYQLK